MSKELTLAELRNVFTQRQMDAPTAPFPMHGDQVRLPINVYQVRQHGALEDRTLEIIGTDKTPDRYNSVIEPSGWNFRDFDKNPVLLWGHDPHQPPIGQILSHDIVKVEREIPDRDPKNPANTKTKRVQMDAVRFLAKFADKETYAFADTIYRLYQGGFLRAVSVGFDPKKVRLLDISNEDDMAETLELGLEPTNGWFAPLVYEKQDLLELSSVTIPANPNALVEQLQRSAPPSCRASLDNVDPKTIDEEWVKDVLDMFSRAEDRAEPKILEGTGDAFVSTADNSNESENKDGDENRPVELDNYFDSVERTIEAAKNELSKRLDSIEDSLKSLNNGLEELRKRAVLVTGKQAKGNHGHGTPRGDVSLLLEENKKVERALDGLRNLFSNK